MLLPYNLLTKDALGTISNQLLRPLWRGCPFLGELKIYGNQFRHLFGTLKSVLCGEVSIMYLGGSTTVYDLLVETIA